MKSIELVSGLSEVSRGSSRPAQSGLALEGLAIASQTIVRLQARRIESWIKRLWDKAIPLILQFYTTDRVKSIVGAGHELETFIFEHAAFHLGMADPKTHLNDFTLHVQPGSGLAATKVQRAMLMGQLHRLGVVPAIDLLRAAEIADPEGTLERARAEQQQMAAQRPLGPPSSGGRRRGALSSM